MYCQEYVYLQTPLVKTLPTEVVILVDVILLMNVADAKVRDSNNGNEQH